MPRLRIKVKDKFHDVAITGKVFSLGRAEQCDYKIYSGYISRRHCEIHHQGQGFLLVDLESKMGTWLNGKQVTGSVPLVLGDTIKFANRIEAIFLPDHELSDTETLVAQKKRIQKDTACLIGLTEPFSGKEFSLHRNLTRIGRAADNQIVIPVDTISTYHAEITREGETLVVTDLDSGNGIYINEQRIKRATLRPNDLIRFDRVTFRYEETHFRMESDGTRIRSENERASIAPSLDTLPQLAPPAETPKDIFDRTLLQDCPPIRKAKVKPRKDWLSLMLLLILASGAAFAFWYLMQRFLPH